MPFPRKRENVKRLSHVGKGVRCVKDVTGHFRCDALTILNLHSNAIASFEGLRELHALTDLNLSANRITQLHGFPLLAKLTALNLSSNGLKTCEGLPRLPRLKRLMLAHNALTHLRGLNALKGGPLTHLDIRGNPVPLNMDAPELQGLSALEILRHDEESTDVDASITQSEPKPLANETAVGFDKEQKDQRQISSIHRSASVPSFDATSCSVQSQATDQERVAVLPRPSLSVAVGYPAMAPVMDDVSRMTRGVQTEEIRGERRDVCVSCDVEWAHKCVWTEDDGIVVHTRSIGVDADIPTREVEQLKADITQLTHQMELLKAELISKEKKQMKVESEFLCKVRDLKERSAERLKRQKEHAASEWMKRQEIHETTVKNYQKKMTEAEDVIQTLKELAKKTHGELERQKSVNADVVRRLDEAKTALEEERRLRRCDVEDTRKRHAAELADMSHQLTATNDRLVKETKRVEELETSLSTASTELADVKRETAETASVLSSKVKEYEAELEHCSERLNRLQDSENELREKLEAEKRERDCERETHRKERVRLEKAHEENVETAVKGAYTEGEAKGKESVDERLRQETTRLRKTFAAVECKWKAALTDGEKANVDLRKRLKDEESKAHELQIAVHGAVQRSRQQEDVMREMQTVLQTQKQTIQSLKTEVSSLSAQIDASSVVKLNALEAEIASLKASAEKAEDFRIRLERAERRLKEKEEEWKAFEREKSELAFEMEKSVRCLRHELQRVRNKNRDLVALSDGLHKDKVSLADAVKVKETMVASAHETIAELREDIAEAQREASDLQRRLDDAETEATELQNRSVRETEKHNEELTCVRTSLEMAVEEEKETTKMLQKRLAQKQSEYEEKTHAIRDIEEQIHTYRTAYEERIQKVEREKDDALTRLTAALSAEERCQTAQTDLESQLAKLRETLQIEVMQKQKALEIAARMKKEKETSAHRVRELESDMKRLLQSLDRDRLQSADKMRQLERLLAELRMPLLKGT